MRERMRMFQGNQRRIPMGRGRYPDADKPGSGIGGYCICPKCGYKAAHITARPCNEFVCPKCGIKLTRE